MGFNMMRLLLMMMLVGGLAWAGGCRAGAPDAGGHELVQMPYPKDAKYGEDLDIVATRTRTALRLNNRTPRSYENVQVWLNQQYVATLRRLRIGDDNRYNLDRFINEHGQSYPVGGILTPDKGYPVVLTELFDPETGLRHRLLTRLPHDR